MILANAKNIIVNGKVDPDIYVNGVHVWPINGTIETFRVYIEFADNQSDNMTFRGAGWNGNPGSLSESMILEASVKNDSSWSTMSSSDLAKVLDTSSGGSIYCQAISLLIDATTFINFQWRTQQYYAPTHNVKMTVYANYTEGDTRLRAEKTVTQAADTTFVIHDGEFDV